MRKEDAKSQSATTVVPITQLSGPPPSGPAGAQTSERRPGQAGLFVAGLLIARRRRAITMKSGATRFLIDMAVQAGPDLYHVEQWSDLAAPPGVPAAGTAVCLTVSQRIVVDQRGLPVIHLVRGETRGGEEY